MNSLALLLLVRAATGSYADAGFVSAAYAVSFALASPYRARTADRRGPPGPRPPPPPPPRPDRRPPRPVVRPPRHGGSAPARLRTARGARRCRSADARHGRRRAPHRGHRAAPRVRHARALGRDRAG